MDPEITSQMINHMNRQLDQTIYARLLEENPNIPILLEKAKTESSGGVLIKVDTYGKFVSFETRMDINPGIIEVVVEDHITFHMPL